MNGDWYGDIVFVFGVYVFMLVICQMGFYGYVVFGVVGVFGVGGFDYWYFIVWYVQVDQKIGGGFCQYQ